MPVLVKDIMSKPVFSIEDSKTAQDAAGMMNKMRRGFLVVTGKKKAIGVLTDSDLIRHVVSKNRKADQVKIKDMMTRPIITVSPNDSILDASRKMKKSNIHRLPVIEGTKLVGVISLTDIARTSPEMLDLLEYRLKMKEFPFEIKEEFTSGICESCGNYSSDLKNKDNSWLCESCRELEE